MAGRILGIDLGEKRVGLALSDPAGIIASPIGKIEYHDDAQLLREIEKLAKDSGVTELVVGLPIRTSGLKGKQAERAEAFSKILQERLGLPVHLWDERMSTVAAERSLLEGDLSRNKRKQIRDQVAASIILQGFLESRRNLY